MMMFALGLAVGIGILVAFEAAILYVESSEL